MVLSSLNNAGPKILNSLIGCTEFKVEFQGNVSQILVQASGILILGLGTPCHQLRANIANSLQPILDIAQPFDLRVQRMVFCWQNDVEEI
jgi:aromatic ring-opening dioxygenase catalytic subunit (LigB family)